jgi:hypothetical protein
MQVAEALAPALDERGLEELEETGVLRANALRGDERRRAGRGPDPIEVLLVERYQPCLRDPPVRDAVDAGRTPYDLPTAERGATVGELDERLLVVCLAILGDPDRPSGELPSEAEVPGDRLAAA